MIGSNRPKISDARTPRFLAAALLWILGFLMPLSGTAQDNDAVKGVISSEDGFRAVFLGKIPPRVTWPRSSFSGTNTNIVIAILGPAPSFSSLLRELVRKESVDGRPIVIRTNVDPESLDGCNILYVPKEQQEEWKAFRRLSGGSGAEGILTIGEDSDFLDSGGIVRVIPDKQMFEVHVGNARKNSVHLDPRIVRLASSIKR